MPYTSIDDPSAFFQTALYAGNNTTDHNIANDGNSNLQPDLVWIKQRNSDNPHTLQDTSRGFAGNGEINLLQSASTAQELTNGAFESFNTNGFGVGGTNVASGAYNLSGSNYAAWQWKANGGTTASNTDGSITSTVQANQDAGFSIVTFTTDGTTKTFGHGLGVKPDIVLVKSRSGAGAWIYMTDVIDGSVDYLILNATNAAADLSYGAFTSSTFQYNDNNAVTQVAYCFASKQGYSKFGSYVGNANTNGAFVYTGFKPAWVMVKRSDGTSDWTIFDNKREGYNIINKRLVANSSAAEATYNVLDFVSNGFKFRDGDGIWNGSGSNYIYMAFAENPFTTSTGIPTTAR